jgi:(p)ppGpp synthase/HD superfamily hydrolase
MMKFTPTIYKAINLAAALHEGQESKGDGLPYIVHPFSVAMILMEYSQDEDIIVAGLLHDTIEDTGYTKEQMKEEFGERVTSLVCDLKGRILI